MAKNKIVALLIFWLFIGLCSSRSQPIREKVRQIYTSQIGVREATGKNDGKQVREYLRITGLGEGHSWCAALVSWVYVQAGVKAIRSAWAPAWFPESKVIWRRGKGQIPQMGDVFGLYFKNKGRIAHEGFVDKWGYKVIMTVEGNTNSAGSREGDGVYRKRRLTKQIDVVSKWIN